MKKANAQTMKEINLNSVRQVMKRIKTATKPQLASLTKLSVVTVNSLVQELCDREELLEDVTAVSQGGRPARTYRYNFNFQLALVIYLKEQAGQELVSATVVNLDECILDKKEYILPSFDRQQFYDLIEHFISRFPSIKVIGIGIPGQAIHGEITVSSHQELMGSRMIEEIEFRFKLPVIVENDVNAAISGYCRGQRLNMEQCVLGIYFPMRYPPGMGIYLNGDLIKGKNGMTGEIKYLPLGIDWQRPMSHHKFVEAVCQIIHTVNVVLAPHRIVIYQYRVENEELISAWIKYQLANQMPATPELELRELFQQDFEMGMRWLTLQQLEVPLLDLK